MYNANHHSLISYRLQQGGESKKTPRRTVKAPRWMASNDFIGFSPQGSSIRREPYDREKRKARRRNVRRNRDGETESVQKNERKKERCLYARVCLVVTRGPSIQPVARLAHSFLHSYTLHAIWIDKQTTEANLSYWLGHCLVIRVSTRNSPCSLLSRQSFSPAYCIERSCYIVFSRKQFFLYLCEFSRFFKILLLRSIKVEEEAGVLWRR